MTILIVFQVSGIDATIQLRKKQIRMYLYSKIIEFLQKKVTCHLYKYLKNCFT